MTVGEGGSADVPSSEMPTRAEIPQTSGATGTKASKASGATGTLHNPERVLRRLEMEQTRNDGTAGIVFNAVALAAAPFLGGDRTAWALFVAAAAVGLLNNAYRWYVAGSEERFGERHLLVFLAIAAVADCGIVYYIGAISPILVMFFINLYTACLYYGRRVAFATAVASCVPVVVLGVAYATGLVEYPGLVGARVGGPTLKLFFVALYVAVVALTYVQTLKTRKATVDSIEELDRMARLAARREALFLEARQDLEQALRAGGMGRFTGQELGSYRLGAVLGRGGMGEVYEAEHVETGEPAAVKMLLPEALGRADLVRRFLQEVRIAASLESPHVVQVLEVGDESAPLPYLAMERLRGESLAQTLRRERRLPPSAVLELVRQAGAGVEAAAKAGIVHRDLKPQNLFHTEPPRGPWKILDFGISKLMDSDAGMTRGEVLGTPHYMAPEQAGGEDVDSRADLYSLAAVAYRALTGSQPFAGDDFAGVVRDVLMRMPARPGALVDVHPDVDLAFAIGLAKRPEDRFQSTEELADALEAALDGRLAPPLRARARGLLASARWGRIVGAATAGGAAHVLDDG